MTEAPVKSAAGGMSDADNASEAIGVDLAELFAENMTAKVYRTAVKHLTADGTPKARLFEDTTPPHQECLPKRFPETVLETGEHANQYNLREPDFWTAGFFPGTLHSIFERLVKYPKTMSAVQDQQKNVTQLRYEIQSLCKLWAEPLHKMAYRTDTHDVGFIVIPALRKRWELLGDTRSLDSIVRAAHSLASRYNLTAGAIRSWDGRVQRNLQITCQRDNFIVIIDSMCNLDLLYYAASHSTPEEGRKLYDIATTHAHKILETNLRPETAASKPEHCFQGQWYSTYHCCNIDPHTGAIKQQFTAQGYADHSTWARGQAWGVLGYAQTYMWTKDRKFLDIACGLAEQFLYRMDTSPAAVETEDGHTNGASIKHRRGRYVPLWDFDAPIENMSSPLRDSSSGSIIANGMLILSQALASLGDDRLATRFRTASVDVVRDLIHFAVAPEKARLVTGADGMVDVEDVCPGQTFEGIMKYGTVNNNENAGDRHANSAIVYGDYYLVEYGNLLLQMGFH